MSAPSSRFSKRAEMGTRVPRNTQAPLTTWGSRSAAEHVDQSIIVQILNHYRQSVLPAIPGGPPVDSSFPSAIIGWQFMAGTNAHEATERHGRQLSMTTEME